jgi:release factor glutamine methyltransferase
LLAERGDATGLGVDISEAACLQASANAVLHKVAARAEILQSDWFEKVSGRFDLIVANPPYIAQSEWDTLSDEVRLHEPTLALTDGGDGLGCYRVIAAQAGQYLAPNGRIIFEIGPNQSGAVQEILRDAGLRNLQVLRDLDRRDRAILGQAGDRDP